MQYSFAFLVVASVMIAASVILLGESAGKELNTVDASTSAPHGSRLKSPDFVIGRLQSWKQDDDGALVVVLEDFSVWQVAPGNPFFAAARMTLDLVTANGEDWVLIAGDRRSGTIERLLAPHALTPWNMETKGVDGVHGVWFVDSAAPHTLYEDRAWFKAAFEDIGRVMGAARPPGAPLPIKVFVDTAGGMEILGTVPANDPNRAGRDGLPVIFEVIEWQDEEAVEELLDAGARIESRGFGNATPVLKAALSDSWGVSLMLLERGADPLAVNHTGQTVAYLARQSRVAPDSIEGPALAAVREFLKRRGLERTALPPKEVKAMVEAGTWPPR